jgi:hypothetical protein
MVAFMRENGKKSNFSCTNIVNTMNMNVQAFTAQVIKYYPFFEGDGVKKGILSSLIYFFLDFCESKFKTF